MTLNSTDGNFEEKHSFSIWYCVVPSPEQWAINLALAGPNVTPKELRDAIGTEIKSSIFRRIWDF